jgi:hypothetical protein
MYYCISLGLNITKIKIPGNIVERLWHINNVADPGEIGAHIQNRIYFHLKNNNTVFEELSVSIVNLMVANAVLLATRSEVSKTDICDRNNGVWFIMTHHRVCN